MKKPGHAIKRAASLLGILSLALHATTSAAAPADEAAPLIESGLAEMRTSNYERASDLFWEAYHLDPTPSLEARIGLAEHGLHRWAEAERYLKRALDAKDDPWVKKNRSVLEATLLSLNSKLGWLSVKGAPEGAFVRVDGRLRGYLPLAPLRIEAEEVQVGIEHEGFETRRIIVNVTAGQAREVTVNLAKSPLVRSPPKR